VPSLKHTTPHKRIKTDEAMLFVLHHLEMIGKNRIRIDNNFTNF